MTERKTLRMTERVGLDDLDDIAIRLAGIINELTQLAPAAGPENEHVATIVRLMRANAELASGIAQLLSNL